MVNSYLFRCLFVYVFMRLDVYWCHPVACPPMEDGRFGGCTEWFLNGLNG